MGCGRSTMEAGTEVAGLSMAVVKETSKEELRLCRGEGLRSTVGHQKEG